MVRKVLKNFIWKVREFDFAWRAATLKKMQEKYLLRFFPPISSVKDALETYFTLLNRNKWITEFKTMSISFCTSFIINQASIYFSDKKTLYDVPRISERTNRQEADSRENSPHP